MTMMQPWRRDQFPEVRIDVGSAYELLLNIAVVSSDDKGHHLYEIGRSHLELMRAHIAEHPDLQALLEMFSSQYGKAWTHLMGLVYDCPSPRDVPTLLAHIEATDAIEIRLHMLGYYMRDVRRCVAPEVICCAAEGDPAAQQQYLDALH